MSAVLIRLGVGAVIGAAMLIYWLVKNDRRNSQNHNVSTSNIGSFDEGNITICCICLKEFKCFKKHEIITLPCRHKIDKYCFQGLVNAVNQVSCPYCRATVSHATLKTLLH